MSAPPAPEVTLDDAKAYFQLSLAAVTRFGDSIRKVIDELEAKKPEEPWLELTKVMYCRDIKLFLTSVTHRS